MSSSDNRPICAVLIPWVIAVIAVLGLSVLAPDFSRTKKSESSDEIGLSPLTDIAQTPGRIFNPLLLLAPAPCDGIGHRTPTSVLLCIETRRDLAVVQSLRGTNQGRAPPPISAS